MSSAPMIAVLIRYILFAGLTYLVFYVWKKNKYHYSKIQWRYPENKHIYREMLYSVSTIIIFGVILSTCFWTDAHGYSLSYKKVSDYGWPYFVFSLVIMVILHDAYFYWMHRFLHWKPMFKRVHKVHHLSVNPSPWAAFSFHPVEGVINGGIFPLIAFTIPHTMLAIIIFGSYSTLLNVMGHLGFELMPKYFARHWLFKWHSSATHHNMHHSQVKYNFGLYFNIWDRLLNTNHSDYVERFEKVTTIRDEAHTAEKTQAASIRKGKIKELVVAEPASLPQVEKHSVSA